MKTIRMKFDASDFRWHRSLPVIEVTLCDAPAGTKQYRCSVCTNDAAVFRAFEIHRLSRGDAGYPVPVADEYDGRSWFVQAQDLDSGDSFASLRITPRGAGDLEAEQYFEFPRRLESLAEVGVGAFARGIQIELVNHAAVRLGLVAVALRFLQEAGMEFVATCCPLEHLHTYERLGFTRTRWMAECPRQLGARRVLVHADLRWGGRQLPAGRLRDLLTSLPPAERIAPEALPPLGLGTTPDPVCAGGAGPGSPRVRK